MSENVHLYDTPEKQSHYDDFDTISAALSYAADPEHPYSTVYIVCDASYGGENNPISSDINASVEIQAHFAYFDSSSSISLNGSIKLEDNTKVQLEGPYFTAGVNIILNSAKLLTGTVVSAGGDITVSGDEAKILPLNYYDNQLVISAGGSITVSGYDAKICGASIYAGESIVLENITGSTTASIIGDSGIKANSGDITLGRHAQMISDTSVYAGGSIIVSGEEALISGGTASCSTVYAGENITVSGYNAQIDGASVYAGGNIAVSGYNAQMISDTSVYAGGNIAVSGEGAVIYGSTVSAAGSIDVGAQAKVLIGVDWWDAFGIKLNGDGKKLVAGTSINVAGTIDVGTAATIEADEITITSGNIVLASGAQMIASSINVDGSVTNNNGSIFLKNVESTLKATSISGNGGSSVINLNLTGLGTTYTDDLYILVDGTIDEGTISISVNDDSLLWDAIKAGECKYGPDNVYTLVARPATSSTTSLLYLKKNAPSTLYVNATYTGDPGTFTPDGHMIGYNAFKDNPGGTETPLVLSPETETVVYYANANAYAALDLAVDNAPASLTITTEAVGDDELVTMGPMAVGGSSVNQTVMLSGAKMSLLDAAEPATPSITVSSGSKLDVGDASDITAVTVDNAGTVSVTNSTLKVGTYSDADEPVFTGGAFTNSGKLELSDSSTFEAGAVTNNGNITLTQSTSSVASLSNTGMITNVNQSTFTVSGDVTNAGTGVMEIVNSAEFTAGTFTNAGKMTIATGAEFTAGTFTNSGDVTNTDAGKMFITNGAVFTADTFTNTDTGVMEIVNSAEFTAGTLTNNTDCTINVMNSAFSADSVYTAATGYDFTVSGTSTLNIGNLNGTIRLNNGATISNSTVYADVSKEGETPTYQGYLRITGSSITFAGANTFLSVDGEKGISLSNDNGASATVKSTSNQKGELKAYFINNNNLGGNLTVGSETDACSLDAIALYNRGAITVQGNKNDQERSKVSASEIKNEDANARMTLNYSELTATTLKNYGHGTTAQAGIAITDSTVSITGSLANGLSTETEATIEFNDSTVTAVSVMNYGKINMTNSKFDAASVVNNNNGFGSFTVKGTSTLDIGSLEGKITIANPGNFETPITLTDSQIVGKVENGNRLGIIDIRDPLTFTGTNTLTNITVDATANYGSVTVGTDEGDSLTVKGTSKLNIASLDGTILTDADALTTLTGSNITGGGTNGGTITAQNDLTFTGENTLNSVTLNAANKTVTNTGTLTVGGTLSFNGDLNVAGNASLAVGNGAGMKVTGNISNSGSITGTGTGSLSVTSNINNDDNGTITVDALSTLKADTVSGGMITVLTEGLVLTEDVYHVVDANLQNVHVVIGELTGYTIPLPFDNGVYLFKTNPSTVYINRDYLSETLTPDGNLVGVNAFTNNPDGTETSLHFSDNTEKIVYYANENAYAALNLGDLADVPTSITITTEAVGNNEVVTMGPLTIGAGQTVTLSGAKMSLLDAAEPDTASLTVSSGSTLNVGGESASGLTAQTVNNAGTINVTNSTFAASTLSTSAVDDRFFVAGESTLNIDSLNGKINLNNGATVSNSTVYSDVNVGETTTSCSGRLVIKSGSSVTFAGANTFRDSNNEKGIEIGNLGSVTVKSIAASGDDPAASDYVPAQRGVLKVFGFDNIDTLTVGSDTDACTFDVINLNNSHTLTVNGKTDDLSRLKASSVENYGTIELTNVIAEAGSLQNGNASNTTTTIGITNSEFTADSVTNYSSGISNVREGMTVINSTLFRANSLVNTGTIKFRGKNKLDIGSLSGTLYFDNAEGTQATLNDSSITGGTLQAVSVMKFTGANTLTSVTLDAQNAPVTVGTDDGDSLTVKGTSTLKDVLLNGTILTDNSTTLKNSNITGGAITALASVTVNNSTISSNTFTCNEKSYFGVTFTGENTLDSVTLNAGYVTNGGSLTVKGECELHIGDVEDNNRENGTIKLDGATIINSSIVGGAHGGTLLVESGKTATFSTTESNSNDFGRTSIINSGTSATSYGTITVNGKMTCGTVTNNAYAKIFISDADFTAGTVTNLAEGLDSTGAQITVTDSSFTATTVSAAFHSKFNVEGASSLNITNLTGTIRLNDGATISNSTVYGDINKENWNYLGMLKTSSSAIFAGSNIFLNDTRDRGLSLEINGSATVKSTSNQQGVLKASYINQLGNLTVGSETDACSLDANELRNLGTVTVQGNKNDQKRSKLSAIKVENDDTDTWMTLNYTELTATTLENDGYGTTPQAAMTIGDSIVNITGSLTNGFSTDTHTNDKATIEFNNHSTVTAESVTNYGTHNGTGGNTGRVGFAVTDSTFTVNNTFTNYGWIYVNNSTLHATSLVNNNKFWVYGTSTLNIGTLTGRIDIINGNDTGSLLTLNNSHITGKVNDDGSLSSSIYVTNPLTFTGTNTLTNTQFYAPYAGKTVTVDSGATLTVKGTSKLNIASLDGTILTDADDLTTLTASSITGGTISAQGDLTFTGANTLNSVTLTATDKTVTVDFGATLTVGGTSTLNIGTLGGTITVANGATLSNSSVGGTVKVQSGATLTLDGVNAITTLDLSEATGVVMDWQDQLSFTGFGTSTSYTDKLTINLDNFTAGDLSKPILDSVNNNWTKDMYEALLTNAWYSSDPDSTKYTFKVVNGDLYLDLQEIVVNGGTHEDITQMNGIKTVIQESGTTTEFTKAVYGGTKIDAAGSVTRNTDVTIKAGTFERFFVGGNNIAMPDKDTVYTVTASEGEMQSVAISGGGFSAIVATADRVQKGKFTLNSDLEMNISGGVFDSFVAGGLLNSLYEKDGEVEKTNGTAEIHGDVSLNITGGAFADGCWIYGGCISTSRSVSSYASTIYGDVTVTIDCGSGNTIQLSHLVAGSHGLGQILEDSTSHSGGNTAVVFKGNNISDDETPLITFTDNGELWGGSGRDNVSQVTGKCADSLVEGDRLLSFEGFNGSLNCTKIRDFTSIQLNGGSAVGLTKTTVDLKGIENWTIENGSSLSGNFGNDFTGDALALTNLDAGSPALNDWAVLTNSSDTAFKGFGAFGSVSFGTGEGSAASYNSDRNVWYNDAYVLYCSENSMLLTTKESYTTTFGTIA